MVGFKTKCLGGTCRRKIWTEHPNPGKEVILRKVSDAIAQGDTSLIAVLQWWQADVRTRLLVDSPRKARLPLAIADKLGLQTQSVILYPNGRIDSENPMRVLLESGI